MSNVIKASAAYVGTDQPAVIGKVYEQLFTDASGNDLVRYVRCFKAGGTITAGQMVGCAGTSGEKAMYEVGTCVAVPAANSARNLVYGMSLSALTSGQYGFAVCKGVVEDLSCNGSTTIGEQLATHSTAGMVTDTGAIGSAGESIIVIGICLSN